MDTAAPFDDDYLSGYTNDELLKMLEGEVDVVLDFLDPPLSKNAHILDMPCGKGIQSQILSRKGFDVVGIDGNDSAIKYAEKHQVGPKFSVGRFEKLSGNTLVSDESCDAVLCLDRSFGYAPTVQENEQLLKDFYSKLKPGGRLAVQWLFNPAHHHAGDKRNPCAELASGQIEDDPMRPLRYCSLHDWDPVEDRLPTDYPLSHEHESFRHLWVDHYVPLDDQRNPIERKRVKRADYLIIDHDNNPVAKERKPVDAPVMRSLVRHAGLPELEFKSKHIPKENLYICAAIITKPKSAAPTIYTETRFLVNEVVASK